MNEIIGIIAGAFVFISFLFKSESDIRKINIVGCIMFIIYAILIKSLSVFLLNTGTLIINIYYLKRM